MSNELNTPWHVFPVSREDAAVITHAGVFLIPTVHPELAAHIVRVVNSHDALVDALKVAIERDEAGVTMTHGQIQAARAALAAAGVKI